MSGTLVIRGCKQCGGNILLSCTKLRAYTLCMRCGAVDCLKHSPQDQTRSDSNNVNRHHRLVRERMTTRNAFNGR